MKKLITRKEVGLYISSIRARLLKQIKVLEAVQNETDEQIILEDLKMIIDDFKTSAHTCAYYRKFYR